MGLDFPIDGPKWRCSKIFINNWQFWSYNFWIQRRFLDTKMGFKILGEFSQQGTNLSLVGEELLICSSLSYFLGFVFIVFMVNGVVLMQSFCLLGQIKGGFLFYWVYQLDPVQILSLLAWPNVDGCYSNTPIELTCLQVGSPWEKLSPNPETHFCIKKPHLNPEMVEPKLSIIYEDFWASSGT